MRNGKRLPEWLPWVERLIDLPEQDKQCACGHSLVRIGEDCAERIAAIPPQMIRTVRPKYACHHCEVDQPYREQERLDGYYIGIEHTLRAASATNATSSINHAATMRNPLHPDDRA